MHRVLNARGKPKGKFIDRTTPFGNPFVLGKDGNREEVIRKFKEYWDNNPELRKRARKELTGNDLICWCKPFKCHGDIIAEYLNRKSGGSLLTATPVKRVDDGTVAYKGKPVVEPFKVKYTRVRYDLGKRWEDHRPLDLMLPTIHVGEEGPRVLVVLDQVNNEDVSQERLLVNDHSGKVFDNLVQRMVHKEGHKVSQIMVMNWEAFSTRKLSTSDINDANDVFVKRFKSVVGDFRPHRILVMGRKPVRQLMPSPYPEVDPTHLIGRVREVKIGDRRVKMVATLSLSSISNDFTYHDADALDAWPNLIGLVYYHFDTLLHGENRYTIDLSRFKFHIIDSWEAFRKFYDKLVRAKVVSIDTESDNLFKYDNPMLTAQFALDGDTGYCIPLEHPGSPLDHVTTRRIVRWLRRYLEGRSMVRDKDGTLRKCIADWHIYVNAKHDTTQFYTYIGCRYYAHPLWDCPSAKQQLDENVKFLKESTGIPAWSLAQLALEYGSFAYIKGALKDLGITGESTEEDEDTLGSKQDTGDDDDREISKEDRNRLRSAPLKGVARYGCLDVVQPFQIAKFQQEEARRRGRAYKKFDLVVSQVVSNMIHDFVVMELNGLYVDRPYLLRQLGQHSDFIRIIADVNKSLRDSDNVKAVNKRLLAKQGIKEGQHSLLGGENSRWVFDISQLEHQQLLFFKVMQLKPLEGSERKDGKGYSVDKHFKDQYKTIPEVAAFAKYEEAKHMLNTFIKGFYQKLQKNPDMKRDSRLRPTFLHLKIITGRSAAKKPSLQQVPNHKEIAKAVKRQFVAEQGRIIIKADYSAHEVRNWAIVAGDEVLSASFEAGLDKRATYRLLKVIDEEIKKKWEPIWLELDLHQQNYRHFYGRLPEAGWQEVLDGSGKPIGEKIWALTGQGKKERQSIKAVVFGVIYGKGHRALAEELGITEEDAKKLIKMLFTKFKKGGEWIDDIHETGRRELRVTSPLGRVRHLWGYMHWDRGVYSRMDRQGPNSVIQGTSSDEGYIGGRNVHHLIWDLFTSKGQQFSFRPCNKVHDSSENDAMILDMPLGMYILEHAHTTQVHKACRKIFNYPLSVGLEMEMDIGGSLSSMNGWDWTLDDLLFKTEKSLKWMNDELKHGLNIDKLMKGVQHNAEIVNKLRQKELKADKEAKDYVSERMFMDKDNSLDFGYKFALA